ncbi:MAG: phosphoglucomutase [Desulfurococcaceae archaeon TW002]
MSSKRLFGTAGVRGRYLREVSPETFLYLSAAIATYLKARKSVVGGDGRLTTPLLKSSVIAGLLASGSDVIDVGLVPLPVLAWSTKYFKCDLGIYVTASHNPPQDNGLKAFYGTGMELLEEDEFRIEELYLSRKWFLVDWDAVGAYTSAIHIIEDYVAELLSRLSTGNKKSRIRVLIDTANGAASLVTPRVLTELGAQVFTLNSNIDGRFPGRHPEPRPDILEPLLPVARELGVDAFLAHDGDGDRLAVLSPTKGFVKQDRIIALLAKEILSEKRGTVVVSIDVGNAVKDVVEAAGGKLAITKLGATHTGILKYSDTVMTAEPWKFVDAGWGAWVDGVYQAAFLTKLMIERNSNIDALLKDIPDYPQARISIEVPKELKEEVFENLKTKLLEWRTPDSEILTMDGLRVNYIDKSWLLVRKSGTEPKIRIYGESMTYDDLKKRIDELVIEANKVLKKHGLKEVRVDGKIIP